MSAYQSEYYSGLEVVPSEAPQVVVPVAVTDPAQAPQVFVPETAHDPAEAPQVVYKDVKSVDPFVLDAPLDPDNYQHDESKPPLGDPEAADGVAKDNGKIFGLRRTTFWLVLLLGILIIGGAIGGGVGATLSKKQNTESSSSSSSATTTGVTSGANSASTSAISSSSSSPSSASAASSVSATSAAGPATVTVTSQPSSTPNAQAVVAGCPGVNNTIYTASTGRDRFLKVCALEMPGPTIDITSYNTTTFDACIDKCAQLNFDNNNSTCVAVTWDLRLFDYKICYLKHTIGAWRTQGAEDSYLVTGLLIGR